MALRSKKEAPEKILDVDASMQGTLAFRDPVNLRINGRFEGSLDTKGSLTIGENAVVKADIHGEIVIISGQVTGKVIAEKELKLTSSARVVGDIKTSMLSVAEGGILQGYCQMMSDKKIDSNTLTQDILGVEEVARYLEVDSDSILEWVNAGKMPASREGDTWRFNRTRIDEWVASEKINNEK